MLPQAKWRGPVIPVITNLQEDLSIDHEAIAENVAFSVDHGVVTGAGILLGAAAGGDFPVLSTEERVAVGATVVKAAGGRAPVMCSVQHTNINDMLEMEAGFAEAGVEAVQWSQPYYYATTDEDWLRSLKAFHDETTLPIFVYNTPWEGHNISLELLEQMATLPRVHGVKWMNTDQGVYQRGMARFSGRFSFIDNAGENVYNALLGGCGFITHLATIWPEIEVETWKLLEAGRYGAAQDIITRIKFPWLDMRGRMWNRSASESPMIKAAQELCGRPGVRPTAQSNLSRSLLPVLVEQGPSRLHARALNAEERREVQELLVRLGCPHVIKEKL